MDSSLARESSWSNFVLYLFQNDYYSAGTSRSTPSCASASLSPVVKVKVHAYMNYGAPAEGRAFETRMQRLVDMRGAYAQSTPVTHYPAVELLNISDNSSDSGVSTIVTVYDSSRDRIPT